MLRKIHTKLCDKKNEFRVFFHDMDTNREKLFDYAEFFLKALGCNAFNPLWLSTKFKKIYALYFTLIVPFLTCILLFTVYNVRDDLELEFSALGGMFANFQISVKFFILLKTRKQLQDLKSYVIKKIILTETESKIYNHYNKVVKYLITLIIFCFVSTVTLLILFPLFSSNEYFMPIVILLPLTSYYGHPDFEINYVFSSYCCFLGAFFFIGFDCCFYIIVVFIISKMTICEHYCKQIGYFQGDYKTPKLQTKLINKCAKDHEEYLSLIRTCSSIYKYAFLGQLLTAMSLFVVLIFHIQINFYNSSYMFLISILFQLLSYCFLSELIAMKNTKVFDAVWCSNWYDLHDIKDRKKILLMLSILQKPVGFSADGTTLINMETFAKVFKMAFNFVNFLQTVVQK